MSPTKPALVTSKMTARVLMVSILPLVWLFVVVLSAIGVAVVAALVEGGPWHKWTKEL